MHFGYNVQVSHDGKHWSTVAKTVDLHTAYAFIHGLGSDATYARIREGARVLTSSFARDFQTDDYNH